MSPAAAIAPSACPNLRSMVRCGRSPRCRSPAPRSHPAVRRWRSAPTRRFLYAALRTPPFPLTSFAIDPGTGELTPFASAPLPDSMAYIVTDPTARWLFSASYPGALVAVRYRSSRMALSAPAAGQVIATPPKAHCIVPAPSGDWVYATSLGGDAILRWRFAGGPAGRDIVAHDTAQDRRRTAASSAGLRRYRLLPERDSTRRWMCWPNRPAISCRGRPCGCLPAGQARGRRPAPHARRCAALCQ